MKKSRRKFLAFILAFGMLITTVFGSVTYGALAEGEDLASEEVTTEAATETITEATTEAVTETITEATTEAVVEKTTEPDTEDIGTSTEDGQTSDDTQEVSTEAASEAEAVTTQEDVEESTDTTVSQTEEEEEEASVPLTVYHAADAGIDPLADDDYKTGAVEITSVTMTVNGVDWNQVDVIRDGDRLRISFDWKLNNTDNTTSKFKINIQSLATNIDIAELSTTTLMKGSTPIGTVRVEDGYIYLDITDQNFLADSERTGGGTIAGDIKVDGHPKTGDDVTIGIADFTKDFTFDDGSPTSSMGIWKNTNGSIQYSNGKWYQEYSVMLRANNGTVSNIEIQDLLGAGLSNLQGITVTDSSVSGVNTGTSYSDLNALSNAIGSMDANEQVTFTYKVEVSEEVFKTSWEKYDSKYNNTVSVTYQNNKLGDPETKTASAGMGVSVNTPSINKTGTLVDNKVTWTVTINLNDYKQISTDLKDIIQTIVDTPGDGLTLDGQDLTLDQFISIGDGVYQATYTTTVSEEKLDSPNKEQLRNTVKLTDVNGHEWSGEGSVTTPGREWNVSKTDGTIDSQTGEITWSVTVSDIPEGATNFKLVENLINYNWLGAVGKETGTHTMANANITIDGINVVSGGQVVSGNAYVDRYTVITNAWEPGAEILFKDSLFTGVNAKDTLTITYTSKITDADYKTVEYQWKNTATVSYDYEGVNTSRSDDGTAENEVEKQVLSKSGAVVYNEEKINYTLDVNLDNIIGLASGNSLQIKDTLPDNMELVAGSVKALYYGKNAWNTWNITNDSYLAGINTSIGVNTTTKVTTSGTGENAKETTELTFSITANQAMMDVIRLFHENNAYDGPSPLIRITYQAEVKDKEKFAKEGTTTFTNTASFSSDSYSCDPVSDEREMTPKKVVNKTGAYPVTVSKKTTDAAGNEFTYEIPVATYSIDINPEKFTLGDGTTFTAVDTLGSAFNYDISSIEVTDPDTGAKLVLGQDYRISYSYQANSITFTLPDKRHLQITYEANCNLKKGEKLDASNSTNRFSILDQTSETMKDEKAFSTLAVESDFWADATTGSITLHKFWTDEDGKLLALKGSIFSLYKATYNAAGNKMVLAAQADKTVEITDDTGDIVVSGLALDQIYALVETEAPKGYLKGETYYFVITGSAGVTLPSGMEIRTFQAGDTLYYENEKDQPATYISKRTLDGTAELVGATLAVKKNNDEVVRWTTTKDVKRIDVVEATGDAIATAEAKGNLVAGETYTLEEISAPAGYLVASPVQFTVDDEGKVTIMNKGTDNTATAEDYTLTMYDQQLELVFTKLNGGHQMIAGAVFALKQGNTVLATATSTATAGVNGGNLALDVSKIKADGTTIYTLTETGVTSGYKLLAEDITFTVSGQGKVTLVSPLDNPNISVSGNAVGLTIINEQVVSISGKKTWDDENDRDGKRPASVIIQLQRKLVTESDTAWVDVPGKTVTITNTNLTYTFADLPVYTPEDSELAIRGLPYDYRVVEKADPNDSKGDFSAYTSKGGTATDNYNITNTYVSERIDVSVRKVWDDNNNQDNLRTNIWVQLYKNGTPLGERYLIEMDGSQGWIREWTNLVKYENGVEVDYTVDEVDAQGNKITPTGYTKKIEYKTSSDSGTETKEYTITNTHTAVKTSVAVEKVWDDNNDQDGARPDSVTVTLYADNKSTGKTATLDAAGSWKAEWTDLDAYRDGGVAIQYSVVEAAVTDYMVSYSPDEYAYTAANPKGTLTITNTHTAGKTSYSVRKAWSDANNADKVRPDSISVQLYADGVAVADSVVILNDADNWMHTWTNLDSMKDGMPVVYSVQELNAQGTAIADGGALDSNYTVSYDTSVDGATTITNTHQQEIVTIKAKKVWNQIGGTVIPNSITVQLYANGKVVTGQDQMLTASSSWEAEWTNLPKNANGAEIKYTVREINLPNGWSVAYSDLNAANNTITITNTDSAKEFCVRKIWDDENDVYGRRPGYVRIQLLKDGAPEGEPIYLDDVNGWRYTWHNLQNGHTYTVEELDTDFLLSLNYNKDNNGIPQIGTPVIENGIDTIAVTNTYAVETTEIVVTKNWQDNNDQDGIRPAAVTVALYADNQPTGKTIVLNSQNNWTAAFTSLPVYNKGVRVKYSVAEQLVSNYTAIYSSQEYTASTTEKGAFTITNSYTPGKTSRTVKKVWNDNDNQDNIRPESVQVQLYANNIPVGDVQTLSEDNAWTYTWTDLDVRAGGTDIVYTVAEVNVPSGYSVELAEDQAMGIVTMTNTHTPDVREIQVKKVWKDSTDAAGERPASITVQLYANGVKTGKAQKLNKSNSWTYTWKNLPVNKDGQEITYTVVESKVANYSVKYSKLKNGVITITNSYTDGKTSATVNKVWDDNDDADGIRPDSIKVQLYADGKAYGKAVVLNAKNNWTYTWNKLDIEDNGTEIVYTVKEVEVPEKYEASYSVNDDGTFVITNKHTPDDSITDSKSRRDKNPKTGDSTPLAGCMLLLISAMIMMPAVYYYRKKKEEE